MVTAILEVESDEDDMKLDTLFGVGSSLQHFDLTNRGYFVIVE